MTKYNYEFKKMVVQDYLDSALGYIRLGKKYGISSGMVRKWVEIHSRYGFEGLHRNHKTAYPFEFKMHVVELYLTTEMSYKDVAFSVGLPYVSLVTKWVIEYRTAGPDALKQKKRGSPKLITTMEKHTEGFNPPKDCSEVNTSVEHVLELEGELSRLRIENAYLKALRRLRLEDEARMRDALESSAASEDNLD